MADTDSQWYTTAPARLKLLLAKIPTLGTPDKANSKWLASVGFSGGNDQSMLRVLKTGGLIGSDSVPTPAWRAFKGGDKKALADGVRAGYAPLFAIYPDAHQKDAEALMAYFRSNTNLAEKAQKLCVATFQTFVGFGDFSDPRQTPNPSSKAKPTDEPISAENEARDSASAASRKPRGGTGVGLTVNIQLQLPPSSDGEVYDKLFEAMSKHLRGLINLE